MTRRGVASTALVLLLVALAGCAEVDGKPAPGCSPRESLYTLVLTAEAVRTATLVPCLHPMQPGWEIESLDARNERARFVLASDRGGNRALTIDLVPRCDVSDTSKVPSDEPGTDRYEEIERLDPDYVGRRFYLFPGGCVRFTFRLDTELASGLLNEASLMVGFVARADIQEELEAKTRIHVEDGP